MALGRQIQRDASTSLLGKKGKPLVATNQMVFKEGGEKMNWVWEIVGSLFAIIMMIYGGVFMIGGPRLANRFLGWLLRVKKKKGKKK